MKPFYTNVRQYGSNLLYIGYDEHGRRVQKKIEDYEPTLYVEARNDDYVSSHFYDGTPLKAIQKSSIKEAKEFIKTYADSHNFKLYGQDRFHYAYIADMFLGDIEYTRSQIKTNYLDIEVDSLNGFPSPQDPKEKITAITVFSDFTKTATVWTNQQYGTFNLTKLLSFDRAEFPGIEIIHIDCEDEMSLLKSFAHWMSMNRSDILTGWYSSKFDIPYLFNRYKLLFSDKMAKDVLSPWGIVHEKVVKRRAFGGNEVDEIVYELYGVNELDYIDIYQKYGEKQPSYSLDYITKYHLNKGKLEYEGTISDLLRDDYQKYVEYNIIDVLRIYELEQLLKYFDIIIDVSYAGKVGTYNDAMGTVRYWEILIYNYLRDNGMQPIINTKHLFVDREQQYEGAYVKDPLVGLKKDVVSFDLKSLYPTIIRQINIGPETKIQYLDNALIELSESVSVQNIIHKKLDLSPIREYNYSISAHGIFYRKDKQSFLSALMEKFFNKRKEYQKILKQRNKEIDLIEKEIKSRKNNK